MREFNKNVNKQISEAVQQNPDIAQAVHLYFSQVELFTSNLLNFCLKIKFQRLAVIIKNIVL